MPLLLLSGGRPPPSGCCWGRKPILASPTGKGARRCTVAASHHEQPEAVEALLAHGRGRQSQGPLGEHGAACRGGAQSGLARVGRRRFARHRAGAARRRGADPRLTNGDGLPVLQRFVREGTGSGETASLLIEAGADPNRKYANGEAPLHAAIRTGGTRGKVAVAEALLAGGADPCIRDAQGFIPVLGRYAKGVRSIAPSTAPGGTSSRATGTREKPLQPGFETSGGGSRRRLLVPASTRARRMGSSARGPGRAIEGLAAGEWVRGHRRADERGRSKRCWPSAAALKPFGSNWIMAENQPCQLYNPSPKPGETVTWSGDCVDGKASGEGRVVWRGSYGESVYEGGYRDGKTHGHGIYTLGHRWLALRGRAGATASRTATRL